MADKTTQKDGSWSDTTVWNGGSLPTDGQSVDINHNITFDVDTSGLANGLGMLTIASGKTLTASTSAGSYYLKMKANISGAGTIAAGTSLAVPYPAGRVFTIFLNGDYYCRQSIWASFCNEPSIRRIKLTAPASIGDTVLNVDTDVTGDIWADGNLINIADISGTMPDCEQRTIAAGGIAAGTITVTSGLSAEKATGANIFLISRNVKIIGVAYDQGFAATDSTGTLYAEIRSIAYPLAQNSIKELVIGGTIDCGYGLNGANAHIHSIISLSGASGLYATYLYSYNLTFHNDCIISGVRSGMFGGHVFNGTEFLGNATTFIGNSGVLYNNKLLGCNFHHNSADVKNALFTAHNTKFDSTVEIGNYNAAARTASQYSESIDHDASAGAFRAWTRGGICSSTVTDPPTSQVRSYQHVCESASYPCWRRWQINVEPGRTLRLRVWLKADAGVEIKAQLVLPTADPLITGSGTGEWQQIGTSDTAWHEYITSWTNSATYPVLIEARALATAASGNGYSQIQYAFDRSPLRR